MDLSPKSSPANKNKSTSQGYQVIPIKDDEVATEETIYNEREETESLVGSSSTRSPRHLLSRASSLASDEQILGGDESHHQDLNNDEEDETSLDEEDEVNLRRYHNFVRPAAMEYDTTNSMQQNGFGGFLVHHWNELRQAAHQRRAARLLSMPNPESTINQATVCFVSTFCDATDSGILVAAVGMFLWISIGVLLELKSFRYWGIGTLVVLLRFTGRRFIEMIMFRRRRLSEEPGGNSRFKHSNHGRLPPPII